MPSEYTTPLLDGTFVPEVPRWRDGHLYLSDMMPGRPLLDYDSATMSVRELARLDRQRIGGIGWTSDGTMYFTGMENAELYRLTDGGPELVLTMGEYDAWCNDMIIDDRDRAYIGTFALAPEGAADRVAGSRLSPLLMVDLTDPQPSAIVVAQDLGLPNGMVITDDRRLIVAQSKGRQLTAFTMLDDGTLTEQRTFAELNGMPDGICLDADGNVWVGIATAPGGFQLIADGGEIVQYLDTGRAGFACALGGVDGRTLFLLETVLPPRPADHGTGTVRAVRVDAPKAGIL